MFTVDKVFSSTKSPETIFELPVKKVSGHAKNLGKRDQISAPQDRN